MRRRVVVTGIGCVTPLGAEIETVWRRLLAGQSGVGYTTLFDASNFPTKISAEVRNWDLSDVGENPEDWKYQGRHTHFAVGAAKKAMADSALDASRLDPTRFGVYLGSGEGQQDFHRFTQMMVAGLSGGGEFDLVRFTRAGLETLHPIAELEQEPNMPAGHLASLFGAGTEHQLPDGLRGQQPGHRRSRGNHPPRRSRCHALRRHAYHDSPLRSDRL